MELSVSIMRKNRKDVWIIKSSCVFFLFENKLSFKPCLVSTFHMVLWFIPVFYISYGSMFWPCFLHFIRFYVLTLFSTFHTVLCFDPVFYVSYSFMFCPWFLCFIWIHVLLLVYCFVYSGSYAIFMFYIFLVHYAVISCILLLFLYIFLLDFYIYISYNMFIKLIYIRKMNAKQKENKYK